MEEILDRGLPYVSGPQWLRENVLPGSWVARRRRHPRQDDDALPCSRGSWRHAGLAPGFPHRRSSQNFGVSARLRPSRLPPAGERCNSCRSGSSSSKPTSTTPPTSTSARSSSTTRRARRSSTTSNSTTRTSFPTSPRSRRSSTISCAPCPASGLIVANGADEALERVLARGCYTPVERFGAAGGLERGRAGGGRLSRSAGRARNRAACDGRSRARTTGRTRSRPSPRRGTAESRRGRRSRRSRLSKA